MLSNLSRLLAISFVFVGCGQYNYTHKSYHAVTPSGGYTQHRYNKIKVTTHNNGVDDTTVSMVEYRSKTPIKNSAAMQRATMKPYVVFGKKYYPTSAHIGDEFRGVASWYGPDFHDKKTSNGEIYNMYALTAAHKTLPMNTVVKVTNLENGKSTIVRINDRGPFVKNRIIDLSNKAAHQIDMVKKGTARVKLEVLGFNGIIAKTKKQKKAIRFTSNYYLQVGVFSKLEGAMDTKRKFEIALDDKYKIVLKDGNLNGKTIKRVWISGFGSEQEAVDFKESNNLQGAVVIAQ